MSVRKPWMVGKQVGIQDGILFGMQSRQIAVRMPAKTVAQLDALVESGDFESRAAAVRAGIEALMDTAERNRIGLEIADGYRRIPSTPEEDRWAMEATDASIAEEPW
ncbi:MAG TPA: ribbon-helix-helix domain-containing protein [Acidimicrobiales bacterium]|jgi:Arc/MetJ-type ribon-helix-helix transcriptional regulator|nr:ribbon-helix-helix domain-containing protein [Acidimicrobiales bacterium]